MNTHTIKLWGQSTICAVALFVISYGYYLLHNTASLSHSFAFTGLIMIIASHVLSGTAYFWGIGKQYLGYRKMIGVVGFITTLGHGGINLFNTYTFTKGDMARFLDIILSPNMTYTPAFAAILIMTGMVIVSNGGIPRKLGAVLWRQLLRFGYIAIILLIIHIGSVALPQWERWFETFDPLLPPPSLLLVVFGAFSLILRCALFVALRKRSTTPAPRPALTPTAVPTPIQNTTPQTSPDPQNSISS